MSNSGNLDKTIENLKQKKSYATYVQVENILRICDLPESTTIRIAILGNYTTEMLNPVITGELALHGFKTSIYTGEYDNIMQEILYEDSSFYKFDPDVVILTIWFENFSPKLYNCFPRLTIKEIQEEVERLNAHVLNYIDIINDRIKCNIFINNYAFAPYMNQGIYDFQSDCSQAYVFNQLNNKLYEIVKRSRNVYLIDLNFLFYRYGFDNMFDNKMWEISRSPYGRNSLVLVGKEFARYIKALKKPSKKCLVLDCDNTLWGGILGELGTNGIKIGEDYPGRCYKAFQEQILNLYSQGILIALCSKNNEADVLDVLLNNKDMVVKKEHIATMQINWNNKADNLIKIADELNIGLDSLVFIDDSEFECNLIKEQLPEVSVAHLNVDPSHFKSKLMDCGFFDTLTMTIEDKQRNSMYIADKERKSIRKRAISIEDYLNSLDMEAIIYLNDAAMTERITQLTQKTNQFNLTTRRYSQEEVSKFISNDNYDVICVSLGDKISTLGIIAVVIIDYCQEENAYIDTFLLSCRSIGRTVEDVLMEQIFRFAQKRNCKYIYGDYIKTAKNEQVEFFYKKYGFICLEQNDKGSKWESEICKMRLPEKNLIKIVERGSGHE